MPTIFVCRSPSRDANNYIIDLYEDHVVFIRNPLFRFVLTPFFLNPICRSNTFRYDFANIGDCAAYDIWNRYEDSFGGPIIAMPHADRQEAKALLKKYISNDKPFVTLHVRDSGFYGDTGRTTRNADITNYTPAIQFLLQNGYSVIRAGDPEMVAPPTIEPASDGSVLFDYAHSPIRSETLDAYLVSECEFFVGLASGLASCVPMFGRNSCNVNYYAASSCLGYMEGDLVSFKVFRYEDSGELVPMDALMSEPYCLNPQLAELDNLGVQLFENSPEEILAVVKEFVHGRNGPMLTERQEKAKGLLAKRNFSYGAAGNYADSFLEQFDL